MRDKREQVYTAYGRLAAEMIRAFLESNGFEATIVQESAGGTYGLTVGTLGEVKVFVNAHEAEKAREVLAAMERGEYELPEKPGTEDDTTIEPIDPLDED